jgi:pimeloyl-ACP methyl ester carboxylesterase
VAEHQRLAAPVRRIEFRAADSVRLVADERGEPGAPVVLLLHGGGQTRHAWGATAAVLAARGWRTIAMDLRGHGDSDWPASGGYEITDFAGDVIAVVEQLPMAPFVVGASLGGLAALTAQGLVDGQLYAGVVLVDVTPRLEPVGVERIVGFMAAHPEGFASLDDAARAIADYLPHRRRTASLGGLERTLRECDDGRWRWRWDVRFLTDKSDIVGGDPTALRDRTERLRRELTDAARRLRVPTLLIRGALSDLVSHEGARELLEAVPHARHVDVADAAHMVAGDQNDLFTAAVVDFLDQERRS